MNPSTAETLTNPPPSSHIVYPYTDESQIVDAVSLFATAGFREAQGFNRIELEASGKLVCEDAADLLSTFVVDGIVDEDKRQRSEIHRVIAARDGYR